MPQRLHTGVLGVLVAILALFVALAILFSAALGRMEARLGEPVAETASRPIRYLTVEKSPRADANEGRLLRFAGCEVRA